MIWSALNNCVLSVSVGATRGWHVGDVHTQSVALAVTQEKVSRTAHKDVNVWGSRNEEVELQ